MYYEFFRYWKMTRTSCVGLYQEHTQKSIFLICLRTVKIARKTKTTEMQTRQGTSNALTEAGEKESREKFKDLMKINEAAGLPVVTAHSRRYSQAREAIEKSFVDSLKEYGKQICALKQSLNLKYFTIYAHFTTGKKYEWYLELVDGSQNLGRRSEVERMILMLAEPKSVDGCKLLSMALIDWMKVSRMTKPDPKTKCPFHRPSSNNLRLRTFFATMKKLYCWPYVLSDVEGWDGCFGAWMEHEYSKRAEKYVSRNVFV